MASNTITFKIKITWLAHTMAWMCIIWCKLFHIEPGLISNKLISSGVKLTKVSGNG